MKIIYTVIGLFIVSFLQAQCPTGDVTLLTQQEVEAFSIDYPNCTQINGSLYIGDCNSNSDIVNINALSNLTTISGDLSIQCNALLQNITGLSNLSSLGFGLYIDYNDALASLSGLENITSAEYLSITNNASLPNLTGLDNLTNIDLEVSIVGNSNLASLQGLNNFAPTSLSLRVSISNNDALTSLSGLENLTQVYDEFIITENNTLQDLTGLSALDYAYRLIIQDNNQLSSLDGLNSLTTIDELLVIGINPNLASIVGLNTLSAAGGIDVNSNPILPNLNGLNSLTSIGSSGLRIDDNSALTTLGNLNNLKSILGGLYINNNDNLSSLNGLQNITTARELFISDNDGLTSLTGLEGLTSTERDLRLINNNTLANLAALNNLNFVGTMGNNSFGALVIDGNDSLTNLQGLENLNGIYTGLLIDNHLNLIDLSGLENLTAFTNPNAFIFLRNNSELNAISAVENLETSTWSNLRIQNSPNLAICDVQSVCNYLDIETNNAIISGNASGCNSREAVVAACNGTLNINNFKLLDDLSVYPNPATNTLNIALASTKLNGSITLYNTLGQQLLYLPILDKHEIALNTETLSKGLYILQVKTSNNTHKEFKVIIN